MQKVARQLPASMESLLHKNYELDGKKIQHEVQFLLTKAYFFIVIYLVHQPSGISQGITIRELNLSLLNL